MVLSLLFQMTPTRGMSITDVSFGSDSSPHASAGIVPGGMAPLSLNSPNFVPRQHLVLTRVSETKGVEIIMYNITRDSQERLVKATDDLCHWVSARARLAETIVHQVLMRSTIKIQGGQKGLKRQLVCVSWS